MVSVAAGDLENDWPYDFTAMLNYQPPGKDKLGSEVSNFSGVEISKYFLCPKKLFLHFRTRFCKEWCCFFR